MHLKHVEFQLSFCLVRTVTEVTVESNCLEAVFLCMVNFLVVLDVLFRNRFSANFTHNLCMAILLWLRATQEFLVRQAASVGRLWTTKQYVLKFEVFARKRRTTIANASHARMESSTMKFHCCLLPRLVRAVVASKWREWSHDLMMILRCRCVNSHPVQIVTRLKCV